MAPFWLLFWNLKINKIKGLRGLTVAVDTAPLSCKHFTRLRKRHVGTPKRLSNQMSQDLKETLRQISLWQSQRNGKRQPIKGDFICF